MVSVGKAFWKKGLQHKGFYDHSGAFSSKGWCSGCSNFFRCSEMLFGAFWVQLNIEIQETKYYWGRSSSLKGLWLKFIKKWAPTCCFVLSIFLSNFEAASTNFIGFFQWKRSIAHQLIGYIVIFCGICDDQVPCYSQNHPRQGAFLEKLKAIEGISVVETQTYTLEEAPTKKSEIFCEKNRGWFSW